MPSPKSPRAAAWKPGQSGNPAGRPKGIPNPQARLRNMIDADGIVKCLQEAALRGDVSAARVLLERALPIYRATVAPVELPQLAAASDFTGKARAVLDAVADGRIAPDVGASLTASIGSVAKLAQIDELLARVSALEKPKGAYQLSDDELLHIISEGREASREERNR